jgi:Fe-S oxidoreductase
MLRTLLFLAILVVAFGFFATSVRRIIRTLRLGKPENRFDRPGDRIRNVLRIAFGQSKLLREPLAGWMHFFIFWGFVILLSAVLEAIAEGLVPGATLSRLGPLFPVIAFLQETVGILVILSVAAGLARWYVVPPKRYFGPEVTGHVRADATFILCLIATVIVSMFGTNATRMALDGTTVSARFVSVQFAGLFRQESASTWFEVFWWVHILAVLGFLNYLPFSKHLHVLTSIPNVYFSSLRPKGALAKLNLEDENAEKFGVDDVREFTWKQLLDGLTCTDCGRCTSVCPANLTGKPLSPRKIIMNLRERTSELASVLLASGSEPDKTVLEHKLVDNFIKEEELWACTTCRACMEECPVTIEHVPAIVDMRRYLVLSESRFPEELTVTFKNLETSGNPWGFSAESRADWAEGLGVRTMAEVEGKVDVLFWVGCAGAYDARYQKVSRAMVHLMQSAGVDFAILGTEETCNGDPARRAGNEYLAQMMTAGNVETLNRYKFNRIVATCPHCFNTLKHEYPDMGTSFEVLHHTDFLADLVAKGRLKRHSGAQGRVTFHDSCYLGRYNGVYSAPRSLLQQSGFDLVEMSRVKDRGFCCGAGGARMFMEEKIGKRVNVERTEEALSTGAPMIATACPFCMTMMTDGLKAKNAEEKAQIRDIAEVLAEAIGN